MSPWIIGNKIREDRFLENLIKKKEKIIELERKGYKNQIE